MNEKFEAAWLKKPIINVHEVKSVSKLPNGATSIDFGPYEDIDGDHKCVLLTQQSIEKYGLGDLKEGAKLEVAYDQNKEKVLNIRVIE